MLNGNGASATSSSVIRRAPYYGPSRCQSSGVLQGDTDTTNTNTQGKIANFRLRPSGLRRGLEWDALTVEALREQQDIIEQQRTKLNTTQSRLSTMEAKLQRLEALLDAGAHQVHP